MGGKGELVLYKRIRAATKKQRDQLKKEIGDIIDNSFTPISVIALVEEEDEQPSSGKGKPKKKGKKE